MSGLHTRVLWDGHTQVVGTQCLEDSNPGQTRLASASTVVRAAQHGPDLRSHWTPAMLAPRQREAAEASLRLEAQLSDGGIVRALPLGMEARSPSLPCPRAGAGSSLLFQPAWGVG